MPSCICKVWNLGSRRELGKSMDVHLSEPVGTHETIKLSKLRAVIIEINFPSVFQ
jgi:hypothetical protein